MSSNIAVIILSLTFVTCQSWSGMLINGYSAGTQIYLPLDEGNVVNVSLGLNNYIYTAAVIHNSIVYNTGGLRGSAQSIVQILQTLTNITRNGQPMNIARHSHAATVAANYIYVCGGCSGSTLCFPLLNSCERYSIKTEKWRIIQSLPIDIKGHTMVTLNGSVYTFGGYKGTISMSFTISM